MRIEQMVLCTAAALLVVVLLGTQRSFQSATYEMALKRLDDRVAALETLESSSKAHAQLQHLSERRRQSAGSDIPGAESVATDARRVFIDLGANCGNSYLKLKRKKVLEGSWDVYLWEANPQMVKFYLKDLAARDPQVRIVPLAAWTENKRMSFYLTKGQENITDIKQFKAHKCNPRSIHQPAGASSLFSGGGMGDDKKRKRTHQPGMEVKVDAVDFAEWLKDLGLKQSDQVILKIDIEGAEIPLLKKFLTSAPLPCLVDTYYIEWHSWMIASPTERQDTEKFESNFLDAVAGVCSGVKPTFGSWH